jgi:release factor glutamine methyltransferase
MSSMTEPVKPVIAARGDIRSALKEGMARLRAAHVPSHSLAAEVLLLQVLGRDRTWLYTHSDAAIDPARSEEFFTLIERRASGEPTQYLTGRQEFWGLTFEVTPAVLIPRPETEHLVEVALARLGSRGIKIDLATGAPAPTLEVADIGTGSGCLAVALAYELPHARIVATDISGAALEVARRNAARHGLSDRIHFLQADLLGNPEESSIADRLSGPFDVIVSNPPYVASNEVGLLEREVRDHEPLTALVGGATGIEIYARLVEQAARSLARGGIFVVELGYGAADRVRKMLEEQTQFTDIRMTDDLAGIPRVLAAQHV